MLQSIFLFYNMKYMKIIIIYVCAYIYVYWGGGHKQFECILFSIRFCYTNLILMLNSQGSSSVNTIIYSTICYSRFLYNLYLNHWWYWPQKLINEKGSRKRWWKIYVWALHVYNNILVITYSIIRRILLLLLFTLLCKHLQPKSFLKMIKVVLLVQQIKDVG